MNPNVNKMISTLIEVHDDWYLEIENQVKVSIRSRNEQNFISYDYLICYANNYSVLKESELYFWLTVSIQ